MPAHAGAAPCSPGRGAARLREPNRLQTYTPMVPPRSSTTVHGMYQALRRLPGWLTFRVAAPHRRPSHGGAVATRRMLTPTWSQARCCARLPQRSDRHCKHLERARAAESAGSAAARDAAKLGWRFGGFNRSIGGLNRAETPVPAPASCARGPLTSDPPCWPVFCAEHGPLSSLQAWGEHRHPRRRTSCSRR